MTELKAPARAALFAAGLAVVLVAALGVGRVVGPVAVEASPSHSEGHVDEPGDAKQSDYRLDLPQVRFAPGEQTFTFTVVGVDGAVTSYDERHERDLHLIAIRRDLTGYQHVHPTLDVATGAWTVDLLLDPGSWRVIADFVPAGGAQIVLDADLVVEGAAAVQPLGEDVLGTAVDGYDVTLGMPSGGAEASRAVLTVMRDGRPVTDLDDYLGQPGHLVILRDGDLQYVHAHPVETSASGPTIAFDIPFLRGGRYRLFLEFAHGGAVHTAVFTTTIEAGDGPESGEEGEHGH